MKPSRWKSATAQVSAPKLAITNEFGKQASGAWGQHANEKLKAAIDKGDQEAMQCWKADGACRTAGHAVIGGLTGGVCND